MHAVAHAVAHLGPDHARDLGTHAHDRGELDARDGGMRGVQAVEADAHAHHVVVALGMQDGAGRVVAVDDARVEALGAQRVDGGVEALELQREVPIGHLVGGGEVREGARALESAVEIEEGAQVADLVPADARARHARVDGQMVAADLAGSGGGLAVDQGEVAREDRRHEVVGDEHVDAVDGRLGQDEDGCVDAALAQLDTLVDRGDGELVGPGGEHGLGTGDGAMAVCIGLDDGHELHAAGKQRLEGMGVAPERSQIDLDPRPARLGCCRLRRLGHLSVPLLLDVLREGVGIIAVLLDGVGRKAEDIDDVGRHHAARAVALRCDGSRIAVDLAGERAEQRQVADGTALLGEERGDDAAQHVSRPCGRERRGTRLVEDGLLDAHAARCGALGDDGELGAAIRPDDAACDRELLGKRCGSGRVAHEACELALMRCEHERELTACELGIFVELSGDAACEAVQAIGVDDERHGGVEQGGDDCHRARGDAHARTDERRGVGLGDLGHALGGGFGEGAVGIAGQPHDGDLEHLHLDDRHDGLGNGEGHVAGAGARRGLRGHDGCAGEARRAAHHEDRAAGELVDGEARLDEDVEVVVEVGAPGDGIGVDHELGGLLGERGHDDLAAHVAAAVGEQARLEGEHGHGEVGDHAGARDGAGLGRQPARDVDGYHAGAG